MSIVVVTTASGNALSSPYSRHRYRQMSSLSFIATPVFSSTRNGNVRLVFPSANASSLCVAASFGHGFTTNAKSSWVAVSRTRRQKGHASNSYNTMGFAGDRSAGRAAHSGCTVTPKGRRETLASPLVATSRKRLRGAAASPPEKTFSRGHKALSTEFGPVAEAGFAPSSSAPARGTIAREARRGARRARGHAGVTPSATAVVMVRCAERL